MVAIYMVCNTPWFRPPNPSMITVAFTSSGDSFCFCYLKWNVSVVQLILLLIKNWFKINSLVLIKMQKNTVNVVQGYKLHTNGSIVPTIHYIWLDKQSILLNEGLNRIKVLYEQQLLLQNIKIIIWTDCSDNNNAKIVLK